MCGEQGNQGVSDYDMRSAESKDTRTFHVYHLFQSPIIICPDTRVHNFVRAKEMPDTHGWSRSISDGGARDFKIYVHRARSCININLALLEPNFTSLLAYVSGPFSHVYGALKERQQ